MTEQAVTDLKSCEAWLERSALAEPRHACAALTVLLESLQDAPPRDSDYVEILERLREPVVVALAERAKKFSARPLPLSTAEHEAFDQTLDLWQSLAAPYCRLFTAAIEEKRPDLRGKEALLAQRAMDCLVDIMLSHYRCRREIDAEIWKELHGLHALADKAGVARETVSVGRKSKSVSSAAEVYARALLLALANPYTLSVRELNWTRRWSAKWAYKVRFSRGEVDCYAVDPQSGQPPMWAQQAASNMLTLDASDIRRSIRGRIKKIEAGESPESLGLGNDCVQPDCTALLQQLARAWTEQPAVRQFNRRSTPGSADLSTSFESIHIAITGRAFKDAQQQWSYARRDQNEQMYSYHGAAQTQKAAPPTEKWEMLDESATGFRMRRSGAGERLSQQQLVALRPEDGRSFILCEARWLMMGIDESLTIGVAVLPGVAQGIAMRPQPAPNQPAETYTQAFLLPESPAGPASLILPIGCFQNGRVLELQIEEEPRRVRLKEHLQRGYDYDRAAFVFI